MNDTGIEYMIIIFVKCSVFKIAISNIHLYITKTYILFRIAYGKKKLVMSKDKLDLISCIANS